MKLIIGLGNPGPEYNLTRHNIGFEALDLLATRLGFISHPSDFNKQARNKFSALVLEGPTLSERSESKGRVMLLKPMTYMNLSGQSVAAALAFYQLTPADLIIVLDDIALPCGKLRIRSTGSPGGHNGLKDIQRALSTDQYPRLRIGIDPVPPRHSQVDYVLGKFTPDQRTALTPALTRATDALLLWLEKGTTPTMNRYNSDPPPLPPL